MNNSSLKCESISNSSLKCESINTSSLKCESISNRSLKCESISNSSLKCESISNSSIKCESISNSSLKCFRNDCTDAFYNLALEARIFEAYCRRGESASCQPGESGGCRADGAGGCQQQGGFAEGFPPGGFAEGFPPDGDFFMLWRNARAVIIGSNQVAENEVDMGYAGANGIQVVRRMTGGGAVYHDLGNVNYTYIGKNAGQFGDYVVFAQPVIEFLKSLGVEARHIGKNDIGVGDRKISGGAQAVRGEYILHHGTILFDADVSALEKALTPDPEKFTGKGIQSVRARVCNISEHIAPAAAMGRDEFWEAICGHFGAERISKYVR